MYIIPRVDNYTCTCTCNNNQVHYTRKYTNFYLVFGQFGHNEQALEKTKQVKIHVHTLTFYLTPSIP